MTSLIMEKRWFYLKRIRSSDTIHSIIPMKKDEISIGRSKESDYVIIDETVSRSHALMKKRGSFWTLTNLSSTGILLDEEFISNGEERTIEVGQVIQMGYGKYCYRFSVKEKKTSGKEIQQCKRVKVDETSYVLSEKENLDLEKEPLVERLQCELDEMQKNHAYEKSLLQQQINLEESRRREIVKETEDIAKAIDEQKKHLENDFIRERMEQEKKFSEEKTNLECQFLILENQIDSMNHKIQEQNHSLSLREQEQKSLSEKQKKEAEALAVEKQLLESRLREVQTSLKEKVLLTVNMERELAEKQNLEDKLRELEKENISFENKLETALENENEVANLRENLELLKAQKMSLEQEVLSTTSVADGAQSEVLEKVSNLVENEFQCPICSELFITAIMLGCSHTFCQFCINHWKKKKRNCPNCRTPILSETRSIVVDNFIEKIVASLSEETKNQRHQVVAERKAEVEMENAKIAAAKNSASTSRGHRGRGRQRRGRGRAARGGTTNIGPNRNSVPINVIEPIVIPPPSEPVTFGPGSSRQEPITIDDEVHSHTESNSENGSDSSSVSGDSMVYYGGYGRCYNCGQRGHWANGCPSYY